MIRLLVAVLTLSLAACDRASAPLPKMYQLPAFSLIERTGQPFTGESMRGKVWVADFFFAACPNVCLEMNQRLSYVRYQTAALPDVRYLSISTSEEDTPEELRKYAERDDIKAGSRWFFVTGNKNDIYKLSVEGFKQGLEKTANGDAMSIVHSTRLVLVDREGWIRGFYDGIGDNKSSEAERLIADVKRVAAEPSVVPPAPAPPAPASKTVAQAAAQP